jgi:toxin HigB-1
VIISFKDQATEDIYNGVHSKKAMKIPRQLWGVANRKLDMINSAFRLEDLRIPPNNKLEHLKRSLSEFHSIRINDQYRIIFKWEGHDAREVQITDYH